MCMIGTGPKRASYRTWCETLGGSVKELRPPNDESLTTIKIEYRKKTAVPVVNEE